MAGGEPKGMQWRTFWRLHVRYDASGLQAVGGANARMDKVTANFEHFQRRQWRRVPGGSRWPSAPG